MNDINVKQNDSDGLKLLYCMRITYDRAKVWEAIIFFIVLFSTFNVFLPSFLPTIEKEYLASISLIITVINFFFIEIKNKIQRNAAKFQELFDCHIYGFKQNKYENLKITPCDEVNAVKRSKKIVELNKQHLKDEKLLNWYSDVSHFSDKPTAIFMCQLENVCWSYKLITNYLILLFSLLLVGLFIVFPFYSSKRIDYILNLIISAPLLIYVFTSGYKAFCDYINTKTIKTHAESLYQELLKSGRISMEECISFQNDIFSYRKTTVLIPNWFYGLLRKFYQSDSTETTKDRIKKLKNTHPELFYECEPPKFILGDENS